MSVLVTAGVAAFGLLVGAVSGLLGVGGGSLMVPFIVLTLDKSQHFAEAVSLVVIIPTAVAGVLAHLGRGYVSFKHAGLLAVGGVGGAYGGVAVALGIPTDNLRVIFSVFLFIVGVHVIRQGVAQRRARHAEPPR